MQNKISGQEAAGLDETARATSIGRMRTGTKLIIFLTVAVGIVMLFGGYFMLRQREAILETAMRNEVRAHAATLKIALEDAYRSGRTSDVQRLINRLSENPKVYSVTLFDETGRSVMSSNPLAADEVRNPPQVRQVLATVQTAEIDSNEDLFSLIIPIRIGQSQLGAFEITQPRSFIRADFARARRDIALVTLALFAAIILVVLAVMRRSLLRPINEMLGGAFAIGRGDLDYRVIVPAGGGELSQLASEFNRMADRLAEQRRAASRDAEERLALERELRHKERLASVGRLAAGIAHEMGAPLNVIRGRAEMLQQRPDMPEEKRDRNLNIINAQADGIARIVRQLLTLARPFNLRRGAVEATQLISEMRELIEPEAAKAGVRIEVVTDEQSWIDGDRDLLHQVLLNICLNGLQAMEQGGNLRIEILRNSIIRNDRHFVALRITDTGPGITPDNINNIFDPFFTTKDVGQGSGLGLAVSHRIVEEHNGWIEVENHQMGGAVFTVYLPKPVFSFQFSVFSWKDYH
ncbi:MAG: ATP-binding protein [Acidobacteria bacterium]|nr:ATP-binding protein [Acidobacteriota bacterium]